RDHVQFVQHQPAWLGVQLFAVQAQFFNNGTGLRSHFGHNILVRIQAGYIQQMQQDTGASQVTQEQVAQASTFGSAFDQAWNIGNHKAVCFGRTHHAQVRVQGGERVVRNARLGVGNTGDQRGFSGIGHTQQTDISQHLQLQTQLAMLAFLAIGKLTRGTVHTGFEVQVTQATGAALGQGDAFAMTLHVKQLLAGFCVKNHGAYGHAQGDVLATRAVLVGPTAVFAVASAVQAGVAVVDQGVDVTVGLGIDAATASAVAAIGATFFNEFFSAETGSAVSTFACDHFNGRFVYEFHGDECCIGPGAAEPYGLLVWEQTILNKNPNCLVYRRLAYLPVCAVIVADF